MIPVSSLYDEHIDRPTFSEQKKPLRPSKDPQKGSEQIVNEAQAPISILRIFVVSDLISNTC